MYLGYRLGWGFKWVVNLVGGWVGAKFGGLLVPLLGL